MEMINDMTAVIEAINLTETLVAKANIGMDTRIAILPDSSGNSILIITVLETVMYKIPLRNSMPYTYGAGSGLHMDGLDVYNAAIMNDIINKYSYYANIIYQKLPLVEEKELRNNEEFERLLGLKSDQGLKYYQIPEQNF